MTESASASTGARRGEGFMQKLWESMELESIRAILHWSPDGQYLIVENMNALMEELRHLEFFNQKDWQSFAKQMSIYGWKRLRPNELRGVAMIENGLPGLYASQLSTEAKVFKHPVLTSSSTLEEVKSIIRNAKPKASRSVTAAPAEVAQTISRLAALARQLGDISESTDAQEGDSSEEEDEYA